MVEKRVHRVLRISVFTVVVTAFFGPRPKVKDVREKRGSHKEQSSLPSRSAIVIYTHGDTNVENGVGVVIVVVVV